MEVPERPAASCCGQAKDGVNTARILQQQPDDHEGKTAVQDNDAVAQRIDPVNAHERESSCEDLGNREQA